MIEGCIVGISHWLRLSLQSIFLLAWVGVLVIFMVRIIIIIIITMIMGQLLKEGRILLDVVPFSKELLELAQVVRIDADILQEILICQGWEN